MDCNNINIKELIQKAEKAECFERNAEYYEKEYLAEKNKTTVTVDFFKWLFSGNFYSDDFNQIKTVDDFRKILISKFKKCDQNWLLAQERARYNDQFKEQMRQFENEMKGQKEELAEAWEKFRVIKTKKYQQTLKEINEENV